MKTLVFVDTSEFVAANFAFSGKTLQALLNRAKSGQIKLGMPDVTRQEVIARIEEAAQDAERAVERARREARVLRNIDDELSGGLFGEFDVSRWRAQLIGQFEAYLAEAGAIPIGFDDVDPAEVFEMYFSRKPPFGDGKKKSEFPDAFAQQMLCAWATRERANVLVSTRDGDVRLGAAEGRQLEYVGSLGKLLDMLSEHFNRIAASGARRSIASLRTSIERELLEQFETCGFTLEDQSGDVVAVRAKDIEFEADLLEVHDLADGRASASFGLTGAVSFEADLHYSDPEFTVYDREESTYYVFDTVQETVEREESFRATAEVTFRPSDPSASRYVVEWDSPADISVASSLSEPA